MQRHTLHWRAESYVQEGGVMHGKARESGHGRAEDTSVAGPAPGPHAARAST